MEVRCMANKWLQCKTLLRSVRCRASAKAQFVDQGVVSWPTTNIPTKVGYRRWKIFLEWFGTAWHAKIWHGTWNHDMAYLGSHGPLFGTIRKHFFGVMGIFFWTLGHFFNDFLKTKKMCNVRTINLAVVSRRDLYYVSENESFCFGQKSWAIGLRPVLIWAHTEPYGPISDQISYFLNNKSRSIMIFNDLLKTKKMRNVRTIILAAVSRRDLYYVSENKSFCFGQK